MLLRTPGELFLIVRSSSLGQGGRRSPGRALGERYALEASVWRSGDRIRITAQLIDATTAHRGAEHCDRKIEDVFAARMSWYAQSWRSSPLVRRAEIKRTRAKPSNSWKAYDYYLRASDCFTAFNSSRP